MNTKNIVKDREDNLFTHLLYNIGIQWMEHWDVLSFLIIIITKSLYYGKQISPEYFDPRILRGPVIASILPILALAYLFKDKKRMYFLYIANIVISLVFISDTMYYRYFKDIVSVGAIRNIFLLKTVTSSIKSLFQFKDLLYLLDIVLFIPIFIKAKEVQRTQLSIRIRVIIFAMLLSFGGFMEGSYIYKLSKDQPLLITTMSNKLYVAKVLGNINFHILDMHNFVTNALNSLKPMPENGKEEISTFFQNKDENSSVNLKGAGANKNLIMIQVEALQQFVINKKVNGQEITPNLNKWIDKSLYFDNYFYQVGAGNTSDAEFMSNNSLYPAPSGAAYYLYTGNTLNSLPKLMSENGYHTAAFHGYTDSFWNRNIMYKTEGFNEFYGEQSFNVDEKVGMGLSDESFFNQSLEKIKSFKEPFYSFMVTLSSHYPYDDIEGYGKFDTGEYNNTLLGNYLTAIHYVDKQLGGFLDNLEKKGLMDNSIIVLYGDHNAIPKEYIDQLYAFENISNATDLQWFQYQKVPMLIHFPKDEHKGVNHTYAGQMDLYPTLCNIFNLSNDYMFGKDILNTSEHNVVFRNGSFTDGKIFYVSWTDSYYDIDTGNKLDETPELKSMKEQVLKELKYSDDILNYNLLKSFLPSSNSYNVKQLSLKGEDQIKVKLNEVPQDKKDDKLIKLEEQIKNYLGSNEDKIGLFYYDINSGNQIDINGGKTFIAASTVKVQMNMVLSDLVKKGDISEDEALRYTEDCYEEGTGVLQGEDLTKPLPLKLLSEYSITHSDNIATNMILKRLDYENFRTLVDEKLDHATDHSGNYITAKDEALLLKWLYDNPYNNAYYSQLIENMKNTDFHDRIDLYIPQKLVAHKTGDYDDYVNDAAIVYTKDPYILTIYTEELPNADEVMAEISKIIYEYQINSVL